MKTEVAQHLVSKLREFATQNPKGKAHKANPAQDAQSWERVVFDLYKSENPTVKAKITQGTDGRPNSTPRPCFFVIGEDGKEHLSQNCLPKPVYMWAGMKGFDPQVKGTYLSKVTGDEYVAKQIKTNISEFSNITTYEGLANIIEAEFLLPVEA